MFYSHHQWTATLNGTTADCSNTTIIDNIIYALYERVKFFIQFTNYRTPSKLYGRGDITGARYLEIIIENSPSSLFISLWSLKQKGLFGPCSIKRCSSFIDYKKTTMKNSSLSFAHHQWFAQGTAATREYRKTFKYHKSTGNKPLSVEHVYLM